MLKRLIKSLFPFNELSCRLSLRLPSLAWCFFLLMAFCTAIRPADADDVATQIASVVRTLQLKKTGQLTYTRDDRRSEDGSLTPYILQMEPDGTVSVFYCGGLTEGGKRSYAQTFHHGNWDDNRQNPLRQQRALWDAFYPPMFRDAPSTESTAWQDMRERQRIIRSQRLPEREIIVVPGTDPLPKIAELTGWRIRIDFSTSDGESQSLVAAIDKVVRTGVRVSRINLVFEDKSEASLEVSRDPLFVNHRMVLDNHPVRIQRISSLASDVLPTQPPPASFIRAVETERRGAPLWALHYGLKTDVAANPGHEELCLISPVESASGDHNYSVRLIDSPEQPFLSYERFDRTPAWIIRFVIEYPVYKNRLGKYRPAGVAQHYESHDQTTYSGYFRLDAKGRITGGRVVMGTDESTHEIDCDYTLRNSTEKLITRPIIRSIETPTSPVLANAQVAQREGRMSEAMEGYAQYLHDHPNNEQALKSRGFCLEHMGRLNEACADYRTLVTDQPECLEASLSLGLCLTDLGKPDEATKVYTAALVHHPDAAILLYARALCHVAGADQRAAHSDATSALAKTPDVFLALNARSAIRDRFVSTTSAHDFLAELRGVNSIAAAQRQWDGFEHAFIMTEGYYDRDAQGRVLDTMKSTEEFANLQRQHYRNLQSMKAQRHQLKADAAAIKEKPDPKLLRGSWMVTAVYDRGKKLTSMNMAPAAQAVLSGDRFEMTVNGDPIFSLRTVLSEALPDLHVASTSPLRWWGPIDGIFVGEGTLSRGWYLYQAPSDRDDVEILALKLGQKLTSTGKIRGDREAPLDDCQMTVLMMRNGRMRQSDNLASQVRTAAENNRLSMAVKRLQGQWKVREMDGILPEKPLFWTVEGNCLLKQMEIIDSDRTTPGNIEFAYRLDDSVSPTQIDWYNGNRLRQGIYKCENNLLYLAHQKFESQSPRPTNFRPEPGTGKEVIILERR